MSVKWSAPHQNYICASYKELSAELYRDANKIEWSSHIRFPPQSKRLASKRSTFADLIQWTELELKSQYALQQLEKETK